MGSCAGLVQGNEEKRTRARGEGGQANVICAYTHLRRLLLEFALGAPRRRPTVTHQRTPSPPLLLATSPSAARAPAAASARLGHRLHARAARRIERLEAVLECWASFRRLLGSCQSMRFHITREPLLTGAEHAGESARGEVWRCQADETAHVHTGLRCDRRVRVRWPARRWYEHRL